MSDDFGRPGWAQTDPLLREYYDTEWGMPVREENAVFERLSLEGFQAGLSWLTVLKKREAFREAFHGFDIEQVSAMGDAEIERMMLNPDLIRNRMKLQAVLNNARVTLKLHASGTTLSETVWAAMPDRSLTPHTEEEIPAFSYESTTLARTLRAHGYKFVGPTICFALMTAIGIVDAHLVGSHRRGSSGVFQSDGTRIPCSD